MRRIVIDTNNKSVVELVGSLELTPGLLDVIEVTQGDEIFTLLAYDPCKVTNVDTVGKICKIANLSNPIVAKPNVNMKELVLKLVMYIARYQESTDPDRERLLIIKLKKVSSTLLDNTVFVVISVVCILSVVKIQNLICEGSNVSAKDIIMTLAESTTSVINVLSL